VTWCLKAGIVEPEETSIARQRLNEHTAATDTQATIEELLGKIFSTRSLKTECLGGWIWAVLQSGCYAPEDNSVWIVVRKMSSAAIHKQWQKDKILSMSDHPTWSQSLYHIPQVTQNFNTLTCRHVGRQLQRNKQLYNSHCWGTGSPMQANAKVPLQQLHCKRRADFSTLSVPRCYK
jgi:hypothetical protein